MGLLDSFTGKASSSKKGYKGGHCNRERGDRDTMRDDELEDGFENGCMDCDGDEYPDCDHDDYGSSEDDECREDEGEW